MKIQSQKLLKLICLSFLIIFALSIATEASEKKVYKNQLVEVQIKKSNPKDYNYYYYNKKGKKVKNTWKKVKSAKYYFGKNGKAYKAKKVKFFKENVIVKKIKGVSYGFDANAHLVSQGVYVTAGYKNSQVYYFDKKGKVNAEITQKIKTASKQGSDSKELRQLLATYAGKPVKTYDADICMLYNGVEPKKAIIEQFKHFEVQYFVMPDNTEIVYLIQGKMKY